MADTSKIEWTDATWNPITGCSIASPGCIHCYAMGLAGTRLKHHPSRKGLTTMTKAGPIWNGTVRLNEQWLDEPLRWKRPRMIFVCAHGDLFHESVPDEWIDKIFAVMAIAPEHTFQVLTKRAARMRIYVSTVGRLSYVMNAALSVGRAAALVGRAGWVLPNVWLGVSAERQQEAEERIPHLLATPAAVRFISAEPLIGPIDLSRLPFVDGDPKHRRDALGGEAYLYGTGKNGHPDLVVRTEKKYARLDWVIVGGESGNRARPMDPAWASDLRAQCGEAGVAFFMKQLSKANTKDYKKFDAFPADLRVRQFPTEARPK